MRKSRRRRVAASCFEWVEREIGWSIWDIVITIVGVAGFFLFRHFTEGIIEAIATCTLAILCLMAYLFRRFRAVPWRFRQWRDPQRRANDAAHEHKIIDSRLRQIIDETGQQLTELAGGQFVLANSPHIPRLSLDAIDQVLGRVVLVLPKVDRATLRFYLDENGEPNDYFRALARKSAQIKAANLVSQIAFHSLPDGATRIFYLGDAEDVTTELIGFMDRHEAAGIDVRCLEKWPTLPQFNALVRDFGYYETSDGAFVMHVNSSDGFNATATVDTRADVVRRYREFAENLCRAKTWRDFRPTLNEPMNNWAPFYPGHQSPLEPPHGISAEDAADLVKRSSNQAKLALADANHSCPLSVLILGYTKHLIEEFIASGANVYCLDQSQFHPQINPLVKHVFHGNWLSFVFDHDAIEPFDVVACDESINNLRIIQYSTFFEKVKSWLKPGGLFVGRLMGRNLESLAVKKYLAMDYRQAIKQLRDVGQQEGLSTHLDFACEILPILHSKKVSFNELTETISTGEWNQLLDNDPGISSTERMNWTMPMKLKLSSPRFESVSTIALATGFVNFAWMPVSGLYASRYKTRPCAIGEFYQLFHTQAG